MHQAFLSLFGLKTTFAAKPLGARSGTTPDSSGGIGVIGATPLNRLRFRAYRSQCLLQFVLWVAGVAAGKPRVVFAQPVVLFTILPCFAFQHHEECHQLYHSHMPLAHRFGVLEKLGRRKEDPQPLGPIGDIPQKTPHLLRRMRH